MNNFYENRFHLQDDNMPISIYSNKNFRYRAHWHTEFELAYIESGSVHISINNDRRKLIEGDMAIITSGNIHYYECEDSSSNIIVLVFKPEFLGLPSNWPQTRYFTTPFFQNNIINSMDLDKITTLLYSILDEKNTKKDYYELFIQAKTIELCATLLRYLPTCDSNSKTRSIAFGKLKVIQDVLVYIENNFREDISLQGLAEQFNINPFNLSKKFNSITGSNLKTYINALRVSTAENMIQNSKKPLIDIAMECGFNSLRTFNRTYKAIKGYVPSSKR